MSGFPLDKAKEAMKLALDGSASAGHFQSDNFRGRHFRSV